jgi:hypothetical protein
MPNDRKWVKRAGTLHGGHVKPRFEIAGGKEMIESSTCRCWYTNVRR